MPWPRILGQRSNRCVNATCDFARSVEVGGWLCNLPCGNRRADRHELAVSRRRAAVAATDYEKCGWRELEKPDETMRKLY
jgi:hypothetical protein